MAETFANNASGNLNAGITNVAVSLVLQAGQGTAFPATGNFRILIGTELIIVGVRSGDTLSSLTRGAESTAAAAHNPGDVVTHELTAGALGTLAQTGVLLSVRILTASGTYTPTTGTTRVYVECVGGGGQGGGTALTAGGQGAAGGGGGSAAYAASYLNTGFSGVAYVIGAGGTTSVAGNNTGQAGTDTTFAALLTAKGGSGGLGSAATTGPAVVGTPGAGGVASSSAGDLKLDGSTGGVGFLISAAGGLSGTGAPGIFAPGTPGPAGATSGGANGLGYGAGGSGAFGGTAAAAQKGGSGANGVVRIWEFA